MVTINRSITNRIILAINVTINKLQGFWYQVIRIAKKQNTNK